MKTLKVQELQDNSWLDAGSMAYIEDLYEQYLKDPQSIPQPWQDHFQTLRSSGGLKSDISHAAIRDRFAQQARLSGIAASLPKVSSKQLQVNQLIDAYRRKGHFLAHLDPLNITDRVEMVDLSLENFGLNAQDLSSTFEGLETTTTLQNLIEMLQKTYTHSIGIEYMHLNDVEQQRWLQQQIESKQSQPRCTVEEQKQLLASLIAAEDFEKYLGTRFVGQKRFSLEGGDALIPALEQILVHAARHHIKEVVIGMAHRGRLNTMVNVLGRPAEKLFLEFEGKYQETFGGTGDVKYHRGCSANIKLPLGEVVHASLAFNPSHLEIVNPIVEGSARARQDRRKKSKNKTVLPILIHGDSAFAGQGVVMETLNFSQTRGYSTQGTIHIIVNNQLGFTTSHPKDTRSTPYCTDIAKMLDSPVFHVNGDEPESVLLATHWASEFCQLFEKDVFIDLVCYRRHGHNEADEPMITQPLMYQTIRQHATVATRYAQTLMQQGILKQEEIDALHDDYRRRLESGGNVSRYAQEADGADEYALNWEPYLHQKLSAEVDTSLDEAELKKLAQQIVQLPAGFQIQPQVAREWENRQKMSLSEMPLNWGMAELLSYATLLKEGYNVRLTGQDCGRGTFTHRHAVLHDQKTGSRHIPLEHVNPNQNFYIFDSLLSEEAVLGFEYGYSCSSPKTLVIWEAQFGDFYNGAQMVVDQFISAGEQKWGRLSGLMMLLPHGFEGQGPEHSSGRIERFLQLCAQDNMQVCVPSTPAQIFHLLRRQMHMSTRKPLIVFSPKSFLRHKSNVSTFSELAQGRFQTVIPETKTSLKPENVRRIVFCYGKMFYELWQHREEKNISDTALIRVEQLYPFPKENIAAILAQYNNATHMVWCQEEPKNQGAWTFAQQELLSLLSSKQRLLYAGRLAAAASAEGSVYLHQKNQQRLIADAFEIQ